MKLRRECEGFLIRCGFTAAEASVELSGEAEPGDDTGWAGVAVRDIVTYGSFVNPYRLGTPEPFEPGTGWRSGLGW